MNSKNIVVFIIIINVKLIHMHKKKDELQQQESVCDN